MSTPTFRRAEKRRVKLRLALDGVSGSGKTWTALSIAAELGKRIALVDTERESASLYADRFEFDVTELAPPYRPADVIEAIRAAAAAGYDVVVVDSLSHFWEAEGGVQDIVDRAAARSFGGNKWAGWSEGTPQYRRMIDSILTAPLHVIVTMRSRTEWAETDKGGKKGYERVGTQPVMRYGIEYEFTVMCDLDLGHTMTVSKTRCDLLADRSFPAHAERDMARLLKSWMESGVAVVPPAVASQITYDLNTVGDPDERTRLKHEFRRRFGTPDQVPVTYLEDAIAFVAEVTGRQVSEDAVSTAQEVDMGAVTPPPVQPPAAAPERPYEPTTPEAPPSLPAVETVVVCSACMKRPAMDNGYCVACWNEPAPEGLETATDTEAPVDDDLETMTKPRLMIALRDLGVTVTGKERTDVLRAKLLRARLGSLVTSPDAEVASIITTPDTTTS